MIEKSQNALPKIGYLFHYPKPDHPTEKFWLEIFISSTPTERHFDVLKANFNVENTEGNRENLSVTHPWTYERKAHVCPGLVVLEDRKGKKEEAFTFGGQLEIRGQEAQTVCNLWSTAPILEISGASPLHQFFIEEIEIIFAEHRAKFSDSRAYERQMCKTDPFQLYLACLLELITRLEDFQHKTENHKKLLADLQSQEHRLAVAGLIKGPSPTLESLFE